MEVTLTPHAFWLDRPRRPKKWHDTGLDLVRADGRFIGYRARHEGAPFCLIREQADAVKAAIKRKYGADAWITEPVAVKRWPKRAKRRAPPRSRIILPNS